LCFFSGLEDFTRSPGKHEQKAMQREGPLLVDTAWHSLPLPAQLGFRTLTNNLLEHGRAGASCQGQHRQLHRERFSLKTLYLGNLSIKWVSREDATYACGLLKGFCVQVLTCFFSRERSHLTSRVYPEMDLVPL